MYTNAATVYIDTYTSTSSYSRRLISSPHTCRLMSSSHTCRLSSLFSLCSHARLPCLTTALLVVDMAEMKLQKAKAALGKRTGSAKVNAQHLVAYVADGVAQHLVACVADGVISMAALTITMTAYPTTTTTDPTNDDCSDDDDDHDVADC